MNTLILCNLKRSTLSKYCAQHLNTLRMQKSTPACLVGQKKHFSVGNEKKSLLFNKENSGSIEAQLGSLNLRNNLKLNGIYYRLNSIDSKTNEPKNESLNGEKAESEKQPKQKKPSKFKQFYSQYGPLFVVIHLITVVLWIYGFFLISKQGFDITQLLVVFQKINLMSQETLDKIHDKINNFKTESSWITGANIKHFATAYMVYKVIAPFRYMVSIALVRSLVNFLRRHNLLKKY